MTERAEPTSYQQEPGYPDHSTVMFSIRYPDLTCHLPTARCGTQEPHTIAECGEFLTPNPGE